MRQEDNDFEMSQQATINSYSAEFISEDSSDKTTLNSKKPSTDNVTSTFDGSLNQDHFLLQHQDQDPIHFNVHPIDLDALLLSQSHDVPQRPPAKTLNTSITQSPAKLTNRTHFSFFPIPNQNNISVTSNVTSATQIASNARQNTSTISSNQYTQTRLTFDIYKFIAYCNKNHIQIEITQSNTILDEAKIKEFIKEFVKKFVKKNNVCTFKIPALKDYDYEILDTDRKIAAGLYLAVKYLSKTNIDLFLKAYQAFKEVTKGGFIVFSYSHNAIDVYNRRFQEIFWPNQPNKCNREFISRKLKKYFGASKILFRSQVCRYILDHLQIEYDTGKIYEINEDILGKLFALPTLNIPKGSIRKHERDRLRDQVEKFLNECTKVEIANQQNTQIADITMLGRSTVSTTQINDDENRGIAVLSRRSH